MAIGWLSVLKAVPWTEVISNAPKVADGAKKLWNSVGKKAQPPAADAVPSSATDEDKSGALQARLSALEGATRELHEQMLASSEVIKALAEQNAQLVAGIEAARVRLRWLGGAMLATCLIVLASLGWWLSR
ncbi:MAG: hypothetical protein ABL900_15415 [Burkholderiaceae bacterium]